jgi:hypothetical protein
MKITQEELQLLEELHRSGTFLDPTVLEEARAACQGLQITQTGNYLENVVYAQAAGGVGIMVSVEIENISNRIIRIDAIRLRMPWYQGDFHLLKKPSSKEVRERGDYVLSACGSCGFDSSVVLNHRFRRGSKLYPEDVVEGFLLGEGTSSVPQEYSDRVPVPIQLVVFTGEGKSYGSWMNLSLSREGQRMRRDEKVAPRLCGLRE